MKRERSAKTESETSCESAWDRYWFSPCSPRPLAWIRIATGLLLLLYFASWYHTLDDWFSRAGYLPPGDSWLILEEEDPLHVHYSPLFRVTSPGAYHLWNCGCMAIALLFAAGVATRITGLLALCGLLAQIQRAPWLAASWESWLSMLLLYLNVGPSGAVLSADALLFREPPRNFWTANISRRLIQLHSAAFTLMAVINLFMSPALPRLDELPFLAGPALAGLVGVSSWWQKAD